MANKKGNATNKTPETAAPAAESSAEVIADDVADAAGDPPEPGDDTAADPVVESKPVVEKKSPAGSDKKTADKTRHDKAIDDAQSATDDAPVDEKFEAVEKRKAEIIAKMAEIADDVAAHDEEINTLRDESAELLLELYPQQGENDKQSVAVRGYLNASARERKHRALAPQRLKVLLEKAGLAPIDAAFSRARGRGMARPVRRSRKKVDKPAADQAKDATPTKKAE